MIIPDQRLVPLIISLSLILVSLIYDGLIPSIAIHHSLLHLKRWIVSTTTMSFWRRYSVFDSGTDDDQILAVFFFCTSDSAKPWLDIGFHVGNLFGDNQYDTDSRIDSTVLSRIVVQHIGEDGGCSIVLHSAIAFARVSTGMYGSSSSATRIGDASSNSPREEFCIGEMLQALLSRRPPHTN